MTPVPPRPTAPTAARRALPWLAALVGLGVLAAAGYFGYRAWSRAAERREALALAEKGSSDAALPALVRCLERDPDDTELLWALVKLKPRTGAPVTDVQPDLDRLARLTPDDPAVSRARLELYRRLGRHEDAYQAARRLSELDPGDDRLRVELPGLALAAGHFEEAARLFGQLLAGRSPVPRFELQTGLARAEWELGHTAEALRLVEEALAAAPDFPVALILRGMIHSQGGEDEAAVAVLRRVRPGSPAEQEIVLYHLALSLGRLGRSEEAKKAFAELSAVQNAVRFLTDARQRPADAGLQVRAAAALLAADRPDDARRVREEALGRLGPSRPVLETLATCYDRLGRPDLANSARDKARQLP